VTKFTQAVSFGVKLAEAGHLVTFGIRPTRVETGYGYIQPSLRKPLESQKGLSGYKVTRFIEKPTLTKAQEYFRRGSYLWNAGIFLWKVDTVLGEFLKHEPALFHGLSKVEDMLHANKDEDSILRHYKKLKAVSIDHGIMEQSARTVVIPVNFPWSDVGNWASLNEVSPVDKQGNVKTGNVVGVDCHNSILYGGQRLLAGIGLSDMVVVDTPDATLVCPKSRSQEVKELVGVLKRHRSAVHLEHVTVYRPWGSYTVVEEGDGYKVKRVVVRPKGRLSLQKHSQRREHWVVINGTARVTLRGKVFPLRKGQSVDIPIQTKHRLENPGTLPLEIIEVQNGPYLGEDDIVRFHDDYNRKKGKPS
jgi:mannose-1-phosphate guanylyltransferase/mannose-6-phosphate isomerase